MENTSSSESALEKAERLKKEIEAERLALKNEREKLETERVLGGGTPAGTSPAKKEISPKDYAKAADRGIILQE